MNRLTSLKIPTNYFGAFAKHITNKKLSSMKSHYHGHHHHPSLTSLFAPTKSSASSFISLFAPT
jgi:hypothetical protein